MKWRVHELLHTWVFGTLNSHGSKLVGARLSELLPVVHWYGLMELIALGVPSTWDKCTACCAQYVNINKPVWTHGA